MFSAPLHSSFVHSLKWRYGFTAILDFDQLAVMKETAAGLRIPGKVQAMASHFNGGVKGLER